MLLYPVYALLFADAGLSVAQISTLLVVWSASSLVLELPSGVLADAVSRRALLVLAPLLAGAGFALWVAVGGYWAFLAGFVLWGAHGALQSGALEALVYEALEDEGEAERYAAVMGRASTAGTAGVAAATALAVPVLAVGGFAWLGAASVVACVAAALVATRFPDPRRRAAAGADRDGSPRAILRAGLTEVRASPRLRAALWLVPLVTAVWGCLDEYLPLLAAGTGVEIALVPVAVGLAYGAMAGGGLLAGRVEAGGPRALAAVLLSAALLLAAGALLRSPAGLLAVAAAFGLFQAATVTADARLQHAMDGEARSTVTSLAGLATEVVVLATFALYGLGSAWFDHATLFAIAAALHVPVALTVVARARDLRW